MKTRAFSIVVVVGLLQFLFNPLPLVSGDKDRGMSNLYASYYDLPDLIEYSFVITKPYTEPIDFDLTDWEGEWPWEKLKLTEELEDGSDYSVCWEGNLIVPDNGWYTFILNNVDDGARIFIDNDWITDVGWLWEDPDFKPSPQTVFLRKGQHKIRIDYEQRVYARASLQVKWSGPKFAEEVIPVSSQMKGFIAATHIHSTYSDGKKDVRTILREVDRKLTIENGGVCNISDHIHDFESVEDWAWTDEYFLPTGKVNPIRGEEWSGIVETDGFGLPFEDTGHATVFNLDSSSDVPILVDHVSDGSGRVPRRTYETMLDEASQRGALVWANHPTNKFLGWKPRIYNFNGDENGDGDYYDAGDWLMGIEGRMIGSEVWTMGWSNVLSDNQEAVDWWQRMLEHRLRKVVGIAASDYHRGSGILGPCDRVYARSNSPNDMAAAIKKGRVIMVRDEKSPFAVLEADADRDGVYEVFIGETIEVASGSKEVTFKVTCFDCNKKYRLRIYTSSGGYEEVECRDGDPWVYAFVKIYDWYDLDFVRVELRDKKGDMISMTNPVYINID